MSVITTATAINDIIFSDIFLRVLLESLIPLRISDNFALSSTVNILFVAAIVNLFLASSLNLIYYIKLLSIYFGDYSFNSITKSAC